MRLGVIVTIRLSRPGNLARAVRCWRHAGSTFSLLLIGGARARHPNVCVCVRACMRACVRVCARAYTYLNSMYTYFSLRCAHTYRSSDLGRHLLGALRVEAQPVIMAHVHSGVSCRADMHGCWTCLSSGSFDFYSLFVRRTGHVSQARIKSLAKLLGQKWPPLWLTSPGLQAHRTWWMLMPMEASSSVSTGMVHPSLTAMPSSTRPGDRERSPYLDRAAQNARTTPDAVILALSRSGPGPLSVSSASQ